MTERHVGTRTRHGTPRINIAMQLRCMALLPRKSQVREIRGYFQVRFTVLNNNIFRSLTYSLLPIFSFSLSPLLYIFLLNLTSLSMYT